MPIRAIPVPNRSHVEGSGVADGEDVSDTNERVMSPFPVFLPDIATDGVPRKKELPPRSYDRLLCMERSKENGVS